MILFSFVLGTIAVLLQGMMSPALFLIAYAPWIALCMLKKPLPTALWLAAFSGCLMDLLSSDPMGLHALNYTLTAGILYRYRKHFLHDRPFHLSLLTGLVSLLSTLLQLFLLFLFDRRVPFRGEWIFVDLLGMPAVDALYAFVWFAAPLALFESLRNTWTLFWLKKKKKRTLSPT